MNKVSWSFGEERYMYVLWKVRFGWLQSTKRPSSEFVCEGCLVVVVEVLKLGQASPETTSSLYCLQLSARSPGTSRLQG